MFMLDPLFIYGLVATWFVLGLVIFINVRNHIFEYASSKYSKLESWYDSKEYRRSKLIGYLAATAAMSAFYGIPSYYIWFK